MTPRILRKNASFPHSLRANASSFHFGFGVDWEHQAPWRLSNWMIWEYSFTVRDATRSIIRSQWFIVCDLSGDELNNLTVVTHHYFMYINIQWWESAGDKSPPLSLLSKPHHGGFLTGGNMPVSRSNSHNIILTIRQKGQKFIALQWLLHLFQISQNQSIEEIEL